MLANRFQKRNLKRENTLNGEATGFLMPYFNPLFRFHPRQINSRVNRYVAEHAWVAYPPMMVRKFFDRVYEKARPVLERDRWLAPDRPAQTLDRLIGDTVLDVHHYYEPESINGWLDCSTTYLTLENNGVVSLPISGDDVFYNVDVSPKAQAVSDEFRHHVVGQKIADIYYYYTDEGEADDGHLSFVELENGYVFTENTENSGQADTAGLFLYTRAEFLKIVKESPFDILPRRMPSA